jgi:hypothetical protein
MKTFSHIGIPSQVVRENENYMEGAKLYVTDFAESENNIEWLRFEEGTPMPEVLQTTAHVAFVVEDLDAALKGHELLIEPFEPREGLKIAFIMEDGAPVELMQEG